MNLYRIISFETFIDIINFNRERYVRPCTWEDKFEGLLYLKLYDKKELKKLVVKMFDSVCPNNPEATLDNIIRLDNAKKYSYGQCWSKLEESDALWRIYSYNKHSVRITTTDYLIKQQIMFGENIEPRIDNIIYDVVDDDTLIKIQMESIQNSKKANEAYFHKRKAFSHEEEVRVLFCDSSPFNRKILQVHKEFNRNKENSKMYIYDYLVDILYNSFGSDEQLNQIDNNKVLSIINLNEYIQGVMVNPFAEDWYVDLVKNLCEKYKLKFEGKSSLYTLKK